MSQSEPLQKGNIGILSILRSYAPIVRRYPKTGLLVFFGYGAGNILGEVVLRIYYRNIFDLLADGKPNPVLWATLQTIVLQMIGIAILYNICWRIADFSISFFQSSILRDLTNESFEHLTRRSYNFFSHQFSGGLVAKVRRFVSAFETIHDKIVYNFWMTGSGLLGVLAYLSWTIPTLALFLGLWILGYLLMTMLFVHYRMRFDVRVASADSAVTSDLSDMLTNILNLKIFAAESREKKRFSNTTHTQYKAQIRAWYISNCFWALQSIAMATLEIGGIYIALTLWMAGSISTGTVVLVQSYFFSVVLHTWDIGRAISDTFKALSNAKEFVTILSTPPEVADPMHPEVCRIRKGSIELRSIGFHYGENTHVFKNFSLKIPSGQRVGIVGFSGAGKSTLFKLLLRFLDIESGSILIDGTDIRAIAQDDLRAAISFVPQEPVLFHRSIGENIAYGRAGATHEAVIDAARRAHAHDFIMRLPKGYDTLVGERGIKLSGGERQRIALARVILKDAPILLLDEATSSLDSVSERYIQEELAMLMEGRTTIAIAHRISTIKKMDRIVVMENGSIVEDGSHETLLQKNGTYAKLWEHQSQGFLVEE